MRKKLLSLFIVICMFVVAACGSQNPPEKPQDILPESVSLNATDLELEIGEEFTLKAAVLPENAANKTVSFSVLGNAVSAENGVIKAISAGDAVVTATTVNGITAECRIKVLPEDDGKEHIRDGWLYYEDFSSRRAVPEYFGQDVKGFSRTEIEDGALRMTVINGGSGDHAFFTYTFKETLPARFVAEARVRSDSLAFANLLFWYGETEDYSDTGSIAANVAMDKGFFKINQGSGWNKFVMPYDNGKWYDVRMTVDTGASAYWITVDGTASGKLSFRNGISDIRTLRFGSETAWADVSYASIGVRAATSTDFDVLPTGLNYVNDFEGTAKPADLTESHQNGGAADFSVDGRVTLSTPTSGTVSVTKVFDEALDGTYAAEVRFKNESSAANTFANVLFLRNSALSGTAGNIVTLAVESGNLRFHNGSKWATVPYDGGTVALIDNEWYTLRIVCDGTAKKYKMYLSGENYINSVGGTASLGQNVYLGEFDFRNKTAGDPDSIELAIGTGKAGTRFTVDRFSVFDTDSYEV